MPDNDDKTVKELIDSATRAELEKWFSLPSFEQLAEQMAPPPPAPEDPERAAFFKRRAAALAAIDPGLLEAHRKRVERQRDLKLTRLEIEPRVSTDLMMLDEAMIDRTVAEPREYDLPTDLFDAMSECTPQALLRDLHRPELSFQMMLEWLDALAETQVDARAIIREALAFRPTSAKKPESEVREARTLLLEMHKLRRKPWTELTVFMRNRRVTE